MLVADEDPQRAADVGFLPDDQAQRPEVGETARLGQPQTEDSARRHPGRDVLVIDGERLTYAQLNARANQVANLLVSRGVRPGDTVALSCPNVPAFPIVYYGILKAGGVVVPLNVLFKAREIAYHLTDSGARAYFCFEGTADLPIGAYGHDGFDAVAGCREMLLITATPARSRWRTTSTPAPSPSPPRFR
ncbi:AMP-binding protein [Streptomyces sp. CB00072]|uniref:AMP-binding protein n=1 Tax=Streptomyces sp. CB00072 TaxID=1703928 RepID=UPI0009A1361B|nr:AMP-binding protein [Streptomyces sp. CB00072]